VAELEAAFGRSGVKCELVAGAGGVFDVVVDGTKVFSKHEAGRFPEPREVVRLIEKKTR
jgi:selenoprotein W-related protein